MNKLRAREQEMGLFLVFMLQGISVKLCEGSVWSETIRERKKKGQSMTLGDSSK